MVIGGLRGKNRTGAGERSALRTPLIAQVLAELANIGPAEKPKIVAGKVCVAVLVNRGRVEFPSRVAQFGKDGVACSGWRGCYVGRGAAHELAGEYPVGT